MHIMIGYRFGSFQLLELKFLILNEDLKDLLDINNDIFEDLSKLNRKSFFSTFLLGCPLSTLFSKISSFFSLRLVYYYYEFDLHITKR